MFFQQPRLARSCLVFIATIVLIFPSEASAKRKEEFEVFDHDRGVGFRVVKPRPEIISQVARARHKRDVVLSREPLMGRAGQAEDGDPPPPAQNNPVVDSGEDSARPVALSSSRLLPPTPSLRALLTPIVITNFNILHMFEHKVRQLHQQGYFNLHVIDNYSSYPPLLEYYNRTRGFWLYRLQKNVGAYALVQVKGLVDAIDVAHGGLRSQRFVLTEGDLLFESGILARDWLDRFHAVLDVLETSPRAVLPEAEERGENNFTRFKVGPALRYTDLIARRARNESAPHRLGVCRRARRSGNQTKYNDFIVDQERVFWEDRVDDVFSQTSTGAQERQEPQPGGGGAIGVAAALADLEVYRALIDTHFFLCSAGCADYDFIASKSKAAFAGSHFRVAGAYTARHLPWYVDPCRPAPDMVYMLLTKLPASWNYGGGGYYSDRMLQRVSYAEVGQTLATAGRVGIRR